MKILISPAKKMACDPDNALPLSQPRFPEQTRRLLEYLSQLSFSELQTLWRCNETIARLNFDRLRQMDLQRQLTPAIFAFDGLQYQHMSPRVFTQAEFAYVQSHLRILSGFYGILRPFDGVQPYRLEMQARLIHEKGTGLYCFWRDLLAASLLQESQFLVNLASKEYSKAVLPYLPANFPCVTCRFGERSNGGVREKGTLAKMARGRMVRFLAELSADRPEAMKEFTGLGFCFQPALSDEFNYVFLR